MSRSRAHLDPTVTTHHRFCDVAIALVWAGLMTGSASAASLSSLEVSILATLCAASVPIDTLKAMAQTESGLDPYALHDNTTGVSEKPGSQDQAFDDARAWVEHGDSVDVGLMQINSRNFAALGLTARSALDPCASMAAGAAVLQAAYGGGTTTAERQVALLMALSRYNTGSPLRGIMNGYARTVMDRATEDTFMSRGAPWPDVSEAALIEANAPLPWDVSAIGAYAETHGASWLLSLSPVPTTSASSLPRWLPEVLAPK